MPAPEVLYRLQQKFRKKCDEHIFAHQPLAIPSEEQLSLSSLFSLSHHIELEQFPYWHNSVAPGYLEKADQYIDNTFDIFGLTHNFGKTIDWHLEPKTGKQWPRKFWSKVNIRDGFIYGDPKFVWEANRLYVLPILGLAYLATKKKKYADKFFILVTEWLEENPYPYGVNWTSGIELGVRIANLVWGLSFLRDYKLSEEHKVLLNTFAYVHARHLFRYPSKYSSNNNHAIAEAFGLFLIGVYFPYFENASKWRDFGQTVLERECLRQILPDGGSYEYSSTYLSFVFDFFLLFKIVCDNQKIEYDRAIDRRLEKSCEYIYCLMDNKGNIPNIGDQDSAVLVNFGLDNYDNFKSILNTGAMLFCRPEFQQDNFPDIKSFLLLEGERYAREVGNTEGMPTTHFLKESGLSIIRETIRGKDIVFVGNATRLGMPPLYAHGHLDALSFTLSVEGTAILVDPGTYLYHSGGRWRSYFRSTAAHNTVQIDEADLTDMPGDFMFGKPYEITEHTLSEDNGCLIWQAGHNAYRKLACKVNVNRKVVLVKSEEQIVIEDTLSGAGEYAVKQFFHFHPHCQLDIYQNKLMINNNGIRLEMRFAEGMDIQLFHGSEAPLAGWFSNAFNHLEKTNTVSAETQAIDSIKIITSLHFIEWK